MKYSPDVVVAAVYHDLIVAKARGGRSKFGPNMLHYLRCSEFVKTNESILQPVIMDPRVCFDEIWIHGSE